MNRPKKVLTYLFYAFVSAILHNLIFAAFHFEEPIFFILAIVFSGVAVINFILIILNVIKV